MYVYREYTYKYMYICAYIEGIYVCICRENTSTSMCVSVRV